MNEGDELLATIQQYVRGRVPPAAEQRVVEAVAHTLAVIMNEPRFYSQLRIVIDMRNRIIELERVIAIIQQQQRPPVRVRKTVPKKATPVKKAVKKTSKKPPLPHNVRAFKKGASGL